MSNPVRLNTVILVLLCTAWLYTEVTEHIKRAAFKKEIIEFIDTIEHDQLLERVNALEDECE